uniref:DUF7795 domain-containing protein n=1 Tax=Fagus sylvatica TaxID=28930 RepID=A0A2N9IBK0_FAGSY
METEEGKLNSKLDEKIYEIFKDFLARVTKFEELGAVGARLLAGFQEGLERLRRPLIDRTSELVENIIKANETKRVKSYFEAGCINTDHGVQSVSKSKNILSGLECLLEDVTGVMQNMNGTLSPIWVEDSGDGLDIHETTDSKKEVASSRLQRPEVTDFAALMGIIYSMVKLDYVMQEKIVSALNFKSSSEELESYCLMWSLHPFVNDEIMHQAWKLIP